MSKKIIYFLLIVLLTFNILACSSSKKAIQIKGSDTMVNLTQALAEEFMKIHPEIPIAVTGGGSGTGIAALLNGTVDIAQSSREMDEKELELARKKGIKPKETIIAYDGVTVIVHPSNPVCKLTIKELSDIYTGKIKNWKELGGKDLKIVALSRDRNSGTHVFFLEHVVKMGDKKSKNEFAQSTLMMPSSQSIVEEVASNPQAIGYVGLGYLTKREKAISVSSGNGFPFVVPCIETVSLKKYPISRSLLFYTNGEPEGNVKSFIDFVLSKKGQEIVLKMDFVPVLLKEKI